MKKLVILLSIVILMGGGLISCVSDDVNHKTSNENHTSEKEKEENDYSCWWRQNVEFKGIIINLYCCKTSNQFLNNCFKTMQNELNITFNKFDVKKVYNNFISWEGIKKKYPKASKKLFQIALEDKDEDYSPFSHENGMDFIWYGVPIGEHDYMIFVLRNLNGTEYISFCTYLYGYCTYTYDSLQSFEKIL